MRKFKEIGFTSRLTVLVTIAVVGILTRIPFLDKGFGEDFDGWRVVYVGQHIASGIFYEASRLPGYPVVEYIHALIEWLGASGPIVHNCLALISGLFLGFLFYYETKNLIASAGLLLHPLIWIHSTTSMDYLIGATLIFGTWVSARSHPVLSGLLGGIATGTRMTLTLTFISLTRKLATALIWICVAVISFLPVFLTYGFQMFSYAQSDIKLGIAIYKCVYEVFGMPLFLGILALFIFYWKRIRYVFNDSYSRRILITIGLLIIPYLALPVETAYIIPILPFAYLLAVRWFPKRWLFIGVILAVLNGLISFGVIDPQAYREYGRVAIHAVSPGRVIRDYQVRVEQKSRAKLLAKANYPKNSYVFIDVFPSAIVEAAPHRWQLTDFFEAYDPLQNVTLTGELSPKDIKEAIANNISIYYLANRGLRYQYERIYGHDPDELNAKPLIIK